MKDKIKKYIKEGLIFLILMIIFANAVSMYRSIDLNKNSLDLEHVVLLNNTQYTIPPDKPIMIHFWATWCPVCKTEAGNIEKISQQYEVLTIALKSGTDSEIENYLKNSNVNFKVINDQNGYITNKFDVSIFPTTIIYDKNRNIVFSDVGYTSTLGLYLRMWWASI